MILPLNLRNQHQLSISQRKRFTLEAEGKGHYVGGNTRHYGLTLISNETWQGKNSMYRLHIEDPIYFGKSIRVTIEHRHANNLSNDYRSTAYWYQNEPDK